MAVPAGTTQTFQMVGIREQLSDTIINIAPKETPMMSMIGKTTATTRTPEWMRDTLANPTLTNAIIEGNDAVNLTAVNPDRIKNVAQLMEKTVQVSSTAQVVKTAGRSSEMKYQIAKRGQELKRDMEMTICANTTSVIGNAGVAGNMAGYESWMVTNVSRGATGASVGYNTGTGICTKATDGTPRPFTEALLKTVLQSCYNNGAVPDYAMMRASHKQTASTFGGIATQYRENTGTKMATILGAAGVYISDFGEHKFIANRFVGASTTRTADGPTGLYTGAGASSGSVLLVDPSKWKLAFLQAFKTVPLAKTGHADRRMLFTEFTLECLEERASGIVADLS